MWLWRCRDGSRLGLRKLVVSDPPTHGQRQSMPGFTQVLNRQVSRLEMIEWAQGSNENNSCKFRRETIGFFGIRRIVRVPNSTSCKLESEAVLVQGLIALNCTIPSY
jgi:hypothetical protein